MSKIVDIRGREIIDSRGNPTVEADVVLDCSDNFATRHAVNRACVKHRKPLVSGAAIRFDAQLAVFDLRQPGPLQRHIIIVAEIVDADHGLAACQQGAADMRADEPGSARDEDGHGRPTLM